MALGLPESSPQYLDGGIVDQLIADTGPQTAAVLVDLFADQLVELVATLMNAVDQQDRVIYQRGLHRFKGSASTLGATTLHSAILDLEDRADCIAFEEMQASISHLSTLGQRSLAALRTALTHGH